MDRLMMMIMFSFITCQVFLIVIKDSRMYGSGFVGILMLYIHDLVSECSNFLLRQKETSLFF